MYGEKKKICFDPEEARSLRRSDTVLSSLGGRRLGAGVRAGGAGGAESVDVRLALDAVALVLLKAPTQRLHVARRRRRRRPRLRLLVPPSTAGNRNRWHRRRRCRFHGGSLAWRL